MKDRAAQLRAKAGLIGLVVLTCLAVVFGHPENQRWASAANDSLAPLLEKGRPVDWWFVFKFNAKSFPGCGNTSDDERQALRFDLAAAYEQAGDLNQAKNLFTEIYGVNVSYRGVNERLKSLESRMA